VVNKTLHNFTQVFKKQQKLKQPGKNTKTEMRNNYIGELIAACED